MKVQFSLARPEEAHNKEEPYQPLVEVNTLVAIASSKYQRKINEISMNVRKKIGCRHCLRTIHVEPNKCGLTTSRTYLICSLAIWLYRIVW